MRKMSEELLMSKTAWLSTRCTLTWKVKDTKSKRLIYQLQPRVRGTGVNAFGSLPATQMLSTPTTFDANNIQKPRRKATGGQKPPLSQEVHMLPTPRASGQENPESLIKRKGLREAMQHNLTAAVQLMYPTPVSSDHLMNQTETLEGWKKRAKKKKEEGINLHFALRHAVQMSPTPTKGMHKQDVNDNGEYARRIKSKGNQIMLPAHVKLYPTPRVSDTEGGIVKNVELNNGSFSRKNKQGTRWGVKLKDAVNYLEENEMYPTPRTSGGSRPNGKGGKVLEEEVMIQEGLRERGKTLNQMMYPTPRSRDWKDTMNTVPPSVGKTRSHTLGTKVAEQRLMYGTPKEQDSRAALTDRGKKNMGEQVHQENNAKETGARLSPNFVEFLMGYPPNWTKLEPTD